MNFLRALAVAIVSVDHPSASGRTAHEEVDRRMAIYARNPGKMLEDQARLSGTTTSKSHPANPQAN